MKIVELVNSLINNIKNNQRNDFIHALNGIKNDVNYGHFYDGIIEVLYDYCQVYEKKSWMPSNPRYGSKRYYKKGQYIVRTFDSMIKRDATKFDDILNFMYKIREQQSEFISFEILLVCYAIHYGKFNKYLHLNMFNIDYFDLSENCVFNLDEWKNLLNVILDSDDVFKKMHTYTNMFMYPFKEPKISDPNDLSKLYEYLLNMNIGNKLYIIAWGLFLLLKKPLLLQKYHKMGLIPNNITRYEFDIDKDVYEWHLNFLNMTYEEREIWFLMC